MASTEITQARKRHPFASAALNHPPTRHGLSPKTREAIQRMVHLGETRNAAAAAVGLKENSLYKSFRNPIVRQHFNAELKALRDSERARNLHTGIAVRDDATEPGRTRILACQYLDGVDEHPKGIQINVGVNVQPGYTVLVADDLEEAEIARLAGSTKTIMDDYE